MGMTYFYVFIREDLCLDISLALMHNLNCINVNDYIYTSLQPTDAAPPNCHHWLTKSTRSF